MFDPRETVTWFEEDSQSLCRCHRKALAAVVATCDEDAGDVGALALGCTLPVLCVTIRKRDFKPVNEGLEAEVQGAGLVWCNVAVYGQARFCS